MRRGQKLAYIPPVPAVKQCLSTIRASVRAGIKMWGMAYTGSGKKLSMVFFTGKIVSLMNNPTSLF